MSAIDATWAMTEREWVRLMRQPARIVATVATPVVFLAALGAGFAGSISGLMGVEDGRSYAAFLLPGMISMAALFASVFGAMALIDDRDSGFIRVLLAGPAPSGSIVGAKLLGVGVPAWVQAALLLPACWLLGVEVGLFGFVMALAGVGLMAFGVAGFSLALAWRSKSSQDFHAVMNTVLMPMWLLSGAFYPAHEAAPVVRWLTMINPLAWATDAVRVALSGERSALLGGWTWPLAVVFAAGGAALAMRTIRRARRGER